MATFFSLKKTAATFCLLSFLSISAISCGVANRQILPGGPGIVPGGGSSSQGGGSASGSYIPPPPPTSSLTPTPTTLADAFSKTVEEIGSQQQTITFTASNSVDAVTGFSVVINAEKNPTDWSISGVKKSDSSPCAMPNEPVPLGANDQCKVTITFTPKSIASYDGTFNASLTYSYTNNKGIDPRNEITIPLLSNGKKFSPLLLQPLTITPTNLSQYQDFMTSILPINMGFSIANSIVGATYIGLTSTPTILNASSLYTFNVSSTAQQSLKLIPTPSNSTVSNYSVIPTAIKSGSIFYQLPTKDNYISATGATTAPTTPIGNSITQMTTDPSKMYGADIQGNIFTINSSGDATPFKPVSLPSGSSVTNTLTLSADIGGNGIVYGIFQDDSSTSKFYICKISTTTTPGQPQLLSNNFITATTAATNIIANVNTNTILAMAFSPAGSTGVINILSFDSNLNATTPTFTINPITTNKFYAPVYDQVNNVLYIMSSNVASGVTTYTLTEIDFTKKLQASNTFDISEGAISAPFLTTGTGTGITTKVAAVSSKGNIFIFTENIDTTKNKIIPFTFADGYNFYSLPAASTTFYQNAVNIYNGNLFIPTYNSTSTTVQTNYLFPLNW